MTDLERLIYELEALKAKGEDILESMEAAADAWYHDNVIGDEFRCGCGVMCKLDDSVSISPKPYAPPVCPACADDYWGLKL